MKHTARRSDPLSTIVLRASSTPASRSEPRRRRRWTAEQKAGYLAAYAESGLSQQDFCRKMGFPLSSFCLWRRQARVRKESVVPGFAEVRLSAPLPGATVTIHLPGGAKVEAAVGTDPVWIGQMIKAAVCA